MGLERRIRALEERGEDRGWAAAFHALSDQDREVLMGYGERWEAAGGIERVPQPFPTPEEERVLVKLNELRRRALEEGWPPPPPPLPFEAR